MSDHRAEAASGAVHCLQASSEGQAVCRRCRVPVHIAWIWPWNAHQVHAAQQLAKAPVGWGRSKCTGVNKRHLALDGSSMRSPNRPQKEPGCRCWSTFSCTELIWSVEPSWFFWHSLASAGGSWSASGPGSLFWVKQRLMPFVVPPSEVRN